MAGCATPVIVLLLLVFSLVEGDVVVSASFTGSSSAPTSVPTLGANSSTISSSGFIVNPDSVPTSVPSSGSSLGSHGTRTALTFPPCDCDFNECACYEEYGTISSRPGYTLVTTFTFPRDTLVPVMIVVNRDQLSYLVYNDTCYFEIAGQRFQVDDAYLRDVSTFYCTSEDVVLVSQSGNGCDMSMQYAAVTPVNITTTIPEEQLKGNIVFPTEQFTDLWYYPPQQRLAYIFNYPDNYVITFRITKLDLGYRSANLHHQTNYNNLTSNDFLLVGAGTEILSSIDELFYGHLNGEVTIRIFSSSAHVVLYTDYHEQNATGFSLEYEAFKNTSVVVTTTEPTTTTFSPSLPSPDSTWAPVDGVLNTYSTIAEVDEAFRRAVAPMASSYINSTGMEVDPPQSVSPSDVLVYSTATCNTATCQDSCAAFNFSIKKLTPSQQAWAFSRDDLDTMLRESDLQQAWSGMCSDCTFCEEEVTHSWWVLGGVAAGVVVVTLLLALLVWTVSKRTSLRKSKEAQEEDQKLEALERRRRSSGDVSVIGGVKGSTKASLPFGGGGVGLSMGGDGEDEEHCDMVGFTEYDPDNSFDDMGIGPEIMNDARAMNFYSNEGFEVDEPDFVTSDRPFMGSTFRGNPGFVEFPSSPRQAYGADQPPSSPALKSSLKRRHPREASGVKLPAVEEADNDDGDDVGASQFRSPNKRLQFTVPAEVHQESTHETML